MSVTFTNPRLPVGKTILLPGENEDPFCWILREVLKDIGVNLIVYDMEEEIKTEDNPSPHLLGIGGISQDKLPVRVSLAVSLNNCR